MDRPSIGIMPQEKIRERVLAIARGDYKPDADDPRVWFESESSYQKALADTDLGLFKEIEKHSQDDNT
jgi:predicted transcriptional regulator